MPQFAAGDEVVLFLYDFTGFPPRAVAEDH